MFAAFSDDGMYAVMLIKEGLARALTKVLRDRVMFVMRIACDCTLTGAARKPDILVA